MAVIVCLSLSFYIHPAANIQSSRWLLGYWLDISSGQYGCNMIELIVQKIDHIIERLEKIEAQVVKTNGRVTDLERWKLILTTAVAVLVFIKYEQIVALLTIIR